MSGFAAVVPVRTQHVPEPAASTRPPRRTPAGILVVMRRITGATGAALVVLGFLGLTAAGSIGSSTGPWLALLALLLVTVGFVLLWEAQVVWPEGGTAYPWRRRLAGLTVGLATLASSVVTRVLLEANLPHGWIADTLAMLAGGAVGHAVFRRLRPAAARRIRSRPPGEQSEVETTHAG